RRYPNAAVMAEQIQRLPAELLAKPVDKSVLFDQQLDALFEDADKKKAKARELINNRRYEDAKKLLETIRHRKLRESEEYTLAVQVCAGQAVCELGRHGVRLRAARHLLDGRRRRQMRRSAGNHSQRLLPRRLSRHTRGMANCHGQQPESLQA